LIGDLLAVSEKRPRRWLYRSMGRKEFSGKEVSYRTFRSIFEALRSLALIDVKPGYVRKMESGRQHRRCTRLRSSLRLRVLAEQHGIYMNDARRHFRRHLPDKPLVLHGSSRRYGAFKVQGQGISFHATEQTRQLEAEVEEINEFIEEHDLRHGNHRGYRRIFNCGDAEDFAWNKGGRLYSVGEEDSYQQLSKNDRLRMLIDGEPVVEIDITASFLTILHALRGERLDPSRDPYALPGLPRSVVKAWVNMTLGHHQFHTRWPKETAKEYLEEHGEKLGKAYPVRQVQEAVISALPILADWPEQKLTCFDLMYLESEAVIRTMLRLQRERGMVCLSVHDSIIVPAPREAAAARVLREEYRGVVGVEPALKINRPDGSVEVVSASAGVRRIGAARPAFESELEGLEWRQCLRAVP
jgi:hypothetical protein